MRRISRTVFVLLGVGILSLAFLGTMLYSSRDKRILTDLSSEYDTRAEELYGTRQTPAGLIEDLGKQTEEIARRIGEETPNYPRKEFVYQGGLWAWLKNFFYNRWLKYKDHLQQTKEANIQEKTGAGGIDVKSALKKQDILNKAYEKIDEKFDEIKDQAKEKIKEGVHKVVDVAKEKLDIGTETDESLFPEGTEGQSTSETKEEDIKTTVHEALKPQETLEEIKEALKEVADLGMGDLEKSNLLDRSKGKVTKKFQDIKEGAKEVIKEGISSLLGLKEKGEDKVTSVKEEVKDVKKVWEEAKKKLDEKFEVLKDQAKEIIVEEFEKDADEKGTKKEIPQETIDVIEQTVNEAAGKKGFAGEARHKVEEKVQSFQEKAKEAIKSGIKNVFSKAAEKIKSVFSSSKDSSKSESHDHSKSTSDETQLSEQLPLILPKSMPEDGPEVEPVEKNPNFGIGGQGSNVRSGKVKDNLQSTAEEKPKESSEKKFSDKKPTEKKSSKKKSHEYSLSDEYAVL